MLTKLKVFPFKYNPDGLENAEIYPDLTDGIIKFNHVFNTTQINFEIQFNRVEEIPYLYVYDGNNNLLYFFRFMAKSDESTTNMLYQFLKVFRGFAMYWETDIGLVIYSGFSFAPVVGY